MEASKQNKLYHAVMVRSGTVIYLPTSVPTNLLQFIDSKYLIADTELDAFKRKMDKKLGK